MITTKDCAVQCSLLPAPPLSLFSNSLAEDGGGDLDTSTEESETAEGTDTDYHSDADYTSDNLERYISVNCMCMTLQTYFLSQWK